jgi:hypothetical protein
MEKIDIAIVSVRRPKILDKMLSSFKEHLKLPDDTNVFINVDPVGLDINPLENVDVVRKYFPNVSYRCPKTPSYATAFKWTWSQTTTRLILSLEDDWEMIKGCDLDEVCRQFDRDGKLVQMAFRWAHLNKKYENNQMASGSCVSSLLRGETYRLVATLLDDNLNPEYQIKKCNVLPLECKHMVNMYSLIKDLGREWMKQYDFSHNGFKENFTAWNAK